MAPTGWPDRLALSYVLRPLHYTVIAFPSMSPFLLFLPSLLIFSPRLSVRLDHSPFQVLFHGFSFFLPRSRHSTLHSLSALFQCSASLASIVLLTHFPLPPFRPVYRPPPSSITFHITFPFVSRCGPRSFRSSFPRVTPSPRYGLSCPPYPTCPSRARAPQSRKPGRRRVLGLSHPAKERSAPQHLKLVFFLATMGPPHTQALHPAHATNPHRTSRFFLLARHYPYTNTHYTS